MSTIAEIEIVNTMEKMVGVHGGTSILMMLKNVKNWICCIEAWRL